MTDLRCCTRVPHTKGMIYIYINFSVLHADIFKCDLNVGKSLLPQWHSTKAGVNDTSLYFFRHAQAQNKQPVFRYQNLVIRNLQPATRNPQFYFTLRLSTTFRVPVVVLATSTARFF